jgi:hypothetical protein
MEQCLKYNTIKKKDVPEILKKIEKFCKLLSANKVKDSKVVYTELPLVVQCLFLRTALTILKKKSKYSEQSYQNAFYFLKLFRGELKKDKIYSDIITKDLVFGVEEDYKKALKWNKAMGSSKGSSPTSKSSSKSSKSSSKGTLKKSSKKSSKYSLNYQKHETPPSDDPLYIYYTTLYQENPNSKIAIKWLTEYGVYEGDDREELEDKYENL